MGKETNTKGLTLIELIVTMSLSIILLSIASMNLERIFSQFKIARAQTELNELLVQLRGRSIREKEMIKINLTENNSLTWGRGSNNEGTFSRSGVQIKKVISNGGNRRAEFSFDGLGLAVGNDVDPQPLRIEIKEATGTFKATLEINRNGYIKKL